MAMEQKPVGICLRVSTADQVKGESLEVHERRARSYAKAIDTSTPAGRLFFGLLASMATWAHEEMVSRVAASVPIRAKMGKPLGGQAPYGYRYENKQLVIDETKGPSSALSRGQSDSVHGQAHIPSNFICFWHQSASCVS